MKIDVSVIGLGDIAERARIEALRRMIEERDV